MEKEQQDQILLVKESALDLLGHFSTAAAILAGFFLTAAVFLVSVNAERSSSLQYSFLDQPIGDNFGISDRIRQWFPQLNEWWPNHFTYMLTIFIILFLLAMFSYACYIQAGLAHMKVLEGKTTSLELVWLWQKAGLRILIIGLLAAFISLPWAILRFAFEQALSWTFYILFIVFIFGLLLGLRIRWARKKK